MNPSILLGIGLLLGGGAVLWGVLAFEFRPRRIPPPYELLAPPAPVPAVVRWAISLTAVTLIVTTVVFSGRHVHHPLFLALWYTAAGIAAVTVLAHGIGRRHLHRPVAAGRVLAVVPAFNEPADNLYACVASLLNQTVPVDVVVVDDGSAEPVGGRWKDRVRWVYQPNTGKAGAQVAALRMFAPAEYDFILTVDSDSVLYPDAAEHLLRAMSHPEVQAATGWMYVRNHAATLVSMAADIEIGISCVTGRASRSLLGAMESTSGALALYRASLVYDHLEEYASNPNSIDDDRWLTTRALLRGQVVGVNEAVVATDMPETIAGTWRQRIRWSRSWFLSLPFVLRRLGWAARLSPLVGLFELMATPVIVGYALYTFIVPVLMGRQSQLSNAELGGYAAALLAVRYCQSGLYLLERPARSRGARLHAWLLGTLGEILFSGLLLPLARYWALVRVRNTAWGGRARPGRRTASPVVASALVPGHRYRIEDSGAQRLVIDDATMVLAPPARSRHAACNDVTTMMAPVPPEPRISSGRRRVPAGNRR